MFSIDRKQFKFEARKSFPKILCKVSIEIFSWKMSDYVFVGINLTKNIKIINTLHVINYRFKVYNFRLFANFLPGMNNATYEYYTCTGEL